MARKELKRPNDEKKLKLLLGAIQYLFKDIDNLSAQPDNLRQFFNREYRVRLIVFRTIQML